MAKLLLSATISVFIVTALAACSVSTSGHIRTEVSTGAR